MAFFVIIHCSLFIHIHIYIYVHILYIAWVAGFELESKEQKPYDLPCFIEDIRA